MDNQTSIFEFEIEDLVRRLNEASEAYYNDKDEIMSNFEWDKLFDRLSELEKETGYILPDSPTQKVGYEESFGNGEREKHEFAALSLAKSKDVSVLQKWAGERKIWLSWKLDGITLVATYDDGKLTKLMTRGNGEFGTNITYLSEMISGVPKKIDYKGHFVVRGEATISYTSFNILNESLDDEDEKYANPRNLVAGTLALDISRADEVKERGVCFNAFTLVHVDEHIISWGDRMSLLKKLGFTVVDSEMCDASSLPKIIDKWTLKVQNGKMDIPVDGLVISYDDTDYAQSGSITGHHATNAGMAFKWQDTIAETTLQYVEWSCAASNITPVAVFSPVQLEGTEVKRASLCNITEMKRLGIGEPLKTTLKVFKANMIIPKVAEANSQGTHFEIPEFCPVCNSRTEIHIGSSTGSETLHCTNKDCTAKNIRKFGRFVSRNAMDIDGLSIETLSKFINKGFITDFVSIYHLDSFQEDIESMEGFGKKSFANLMTAINNSRNVNPSKFINALSIPKIGVDAGKKLIAQYGTSGFISRLRSNLGFEEIVGFGAEKSNSIVNWYSDEKNRQIFDSLVEELNIIEIEPSVGNQAGTCVDKTFVITGDVHIFKNRDEFKSYVESQGGKVAGSVSGKTSYLVNNDIESGSSKNKKAKTLGIEIITEDTFIDRFGKPE